MDSKVDGEMCAGKSIERERERERNKKNLVLNKVVNERERMKCRQKEKKSLLIKCILFGVVFFWWFVSQTHR